MMRCETIPRSAMRAAGTTMPGRTGAKSPPSRTASFRGSGRNPGTSGAIAASRFAAARRSSGRTTPSTKPTVKASPFGSRSTPARRAAEASGFSAAAAASQVRTSAVVRAARSCSDSGTSDAARDPEMVVMHPSCGSRAVDAEHHARSSRRPQRMRRAAPAHGDPWRGRCSGRGQAAGVVGLFDSGSSSATQRSSSARSVCQIA